MVRFIVRNTHTAMTAKCGAALAAPIVNDRGPESLIIMVVRRLNRFTSRRRLTNNPSLLHAGYCTTAVPAPKSEPKFRSACPLPLRWVTLYATFGISGCRGFLRSVSQRARISASVSSRSEALARWKIRSTFSSLAPRPWRSARRSRWICRSWGRSRLPARARTLRRHAGVHVVCQLHVTLFVRLNHGGGMHPGGGAEGVFANDRIILRNRHAAGLRNRLTIGVSPAGPAASREDTPISFRFTSIWSIWVLPTRSPMPRAQPGRTRRPHQAAIEFDTANPRSQWPCQSTRIVSPEGLTTSLITNSPGLDAPLGWRGRGIADDDGARAAVDRGRVQPLDWSGSQRSYPR